MSTQSQAPSVPTLWKQGSIRSSYVNIPKPNNLDRVGVDESNKFVLDMSSPVNIPMDKTTFFTKWVWHPKGDSGSLDLGTVGFFESLLRNKGRLFGSIVDSEIHILYLPHLPTEIYRDDNVEISLLFEGATDVDKRLMTRAVFPSPLHTHLIFYPGHSFSVKPGSKFPWSLNISTTAEVSKTYPIADILIYLRGYNTPVSQFSERSGANIISLVPLSEMPSGVVFLRPRGTGDWKVMSLHYGVKAKSDINCILKLQEMGIDVEGLQILGKLKAAMKMVKETEKGGSGPAGDENMKRNINNKVLQLLRSS